MPHNPNLVPKRHAFNRLFGQLPLTQFKSYKHSIKVDLISAAPLEIILDPIYDFGKATWSLDGKDSSRMKKEQKLETLKQMLAGKALPLGLETIQLIFRIGGISRIDTHQIVRQRIGVTFSQQCSGDQFWHHQDCLVEPSIAYGNNKFADVVLATKMAYAEMTNDGVSIQAARSILPHCLETFIFMRVDLATLLMFYKKRIDDGSQTWQLNEISRQMAESVIEFYGEFMRPIFDNAKGSFKFQETAQKDRTNNMSTNLYLPENDTFEYHIQDFLYPQTKMDKLMVNAPELKPEFFVGRVKVQKTVYLAFKTSYETFNEKHVHSSNEAIYEQMKSLNQKLCEELNVYNPWQK